MITVVNKKKHVPTVDDIYIGRPTIIGNQWSHLSRGKAEVQVATREDAVECYRDWLPKAYVEDIKVRAYIDKIIEKASTEDVNLVCWCAPKACHGDVVKEFVEKALDDQ